VAAWQEDLFFPVDARRAMMAESPQMDREAFKVRMRVELEKLLEKMADAVDNAPPGPVWTTAACGNIIG
jgi:hypothetical protein